jgi:peptide/nickel transport system permease protein
MSDALRIALLALPSVRRRWFRRYGLATVGGVVLGSWLLLALLAPWVMRDDPNLVAVASRLEPPSAAHWLGTDALGRDVLTRVVYGARVSLLVGFVVVVVAGGFGTLLGAVAAYARGWAEETLMRLTDLSSVFHPLSWPWR